MESNNKEQTVKPIRLIFMVAALGTAYFFSNFHRLSLGVIGGVIAEDFGLSANQLGVLGSAFFYAYAVMQVPSGIISDRLNKRTLISISSLLTAFGTLWFSMSQSFAGLTVSRVITGLAVAFIYVPALATLRLWYKDEKLGTMTGVLVAMGQVGALFASVPLRASADMSGWRMTFLIIAVVSIVLGMVTWFAILKDPKITRKAIVSKSDGNKKVLTPAMLSVTIWFFVTGGARLSFQSLWGARYFTDVLGMNAITSSSLLMCISMGCIFGAMLFGKLCDMMGTLKTLLVGSVAMMLCWLAFLAFNGATSYFLVAAVSLGLGVVGAGTFTVGFVCVREFADKSNTGIVTGINNCGAFLGSAVFTQFSGNIVSAAGDAADTGFFNLFVIFAVLTLSAIILVTLCNRNIFKKAGVINEKNTGN